MYIFLSVYPTKKRKEKTFFLKKKPCLQTYTDPPRLHIKKVQKEDQGMYQCFVSNEWEQIQSTAELQLGGNNVYKIGLIIYLD